MDDKPILSCSILALRVAGHKIVTLEGLQEEASEFATFIANQGAEQCGFCNPGFMIDVYKRQQYILRYKKENFGYSCLTNQRQFYMENYPNIVIEKGNIDELIPIMIRGVEK